MNLIKIKYHINVENLKTIVDSISYSDLELNETLLVTIKNCGGCYYIDTKVQDSYIIFDLERYETILDEEHELCGILKSEFETLFETNEFKKFIRTIKINNLLK